MLMGSYPFEDPDEPKDFRKTIQVCHLALSLPKFLNVKCMTQDISSTVSLQRILNVQYAIPDSVPLSRECLELISRIFVSDPTAVSLFFLLLYIFR